MPPVAGSDPLSRALPSAKGFQHQRMTNGAMNVEIGNPTYKMYEGEPDDDVGELLDADFVLDPDKVRSGATVARRGHHRLHGGQPGAGGHAGGGTCQGGGARSWGCSPCRGGWGAPRGRKGFGGGGCGVGWRRAQGQWCCARRSWLVRALAEAAWGKGTPPGTALLGNGGVRAPLPTGSPPPSASPQPTNFTNPVYATLYMGAHNSRNSLASTDEKRELLSRGADDDLADPLA